MFQSEISKAPQEERTPRNYLCGRCVLDVWSLTSVFLFFQKHKEGAKRASSSDVISAATVSSVHSAARAASTSVRNLSCRSLPQNEGLSSEERQQCDPDSSTSVDWVQNLIIYC